MEKIVNFVKSHFDFNFYKSAILPLLVLLAVVPCVKFLPVEYGYENGLLENLQMLTLLLCFVFALCAKHSKKFFYFAAMVIFLLIAREVNYGRTIFFAVPGEVNTFYTWHDIQYGWIVNPIVGVYIACMSLYFIFSKACVQMWNIIKNVKFPVWNFIFLFIGMVLGEYAEKTTENFVFEEISELLFYTALLSIIWLYLFNKNFKQV